MLALTAACEDREVILPGQREGVREVLQTEGMAEPAAPSENRSQPAAVAPMTRNASWPQTPTTDATRIENARLGATLTQAWSVTIGQGDKRRARLTATPVAENGRIFTMDSAGQISAVASSGEVLWTVDLTPGRDRADQAHGGALALGAGRLYVTSGFGQVTALDPATGDTIWTQRVQAAATGVPTYYDGLVYAVAGDTTAWAIEADSGRVRWQLDGVSDLNNVSGGPAPAVTDQRVIFAFGNGMVQAAFRQGGLRLWSSLLASKRAGMAIASVDDITGGPVVRGNTVYAGNYSGSVSAMSLGSGERLWTATMGAADAAWPTADSVYLISDLAQLVRLDAQSGETIWRADLPGYVPTRRPQRKRDSFYASYGPIMAGGRLIVASSDGVIRQFDPRDGSLTGTLEVPGGATTRPIVANGTLYVVSTKGELYAFR